MKTLNLIVFLAVFITACSKSPKEETATCDFTVNGVTDVTLELDSVAYLPLEIKHISGAQEKVDLFVNGLPGSVTASITSKGGTPPYTSVIKFSAGQNAAVGNNADVKIKTVSASGLAKEHGLNLNVVPSTRCALKLVGMYNVRNMRFTDRGKYINSEQYTSTVTLYNNIPAAIQILNLDGESTPAQAYGNLDCINSKFTIPVQPSLEDRGYIITGAWYTSSNEIYIQYTGSGGTIRYQAIFTKL
ncbi:MAG: hypothetical protein EOP56_16625 [Sphingobacteriales bacterium]|nr:MAG: hypothetical protein EOP56_16625 [Sphingobacteriales bacterium]